MQAPLRIPPVVNLICAVLCMFLVMWAHVRQEFAAMSFATVFLIVNLLVYVVRSDTEGRPK